MQFKTLAASNLNHAKWAQTGHVPTFEEYMEIGEVEIAVYSSMAAVFMCMEQTIPTHEAYEWLKTRPKFFRSFAIKARLMNDMAGFKVQRHESFLI